VVSSTLRPHFTTGKDPVPILQEAGWAPGPVWTGGKSRPHRDSIPDRQARRQSLYRLSYPAHTLYIYVCMYVLCMSIYIYIYIYIYIVNKYNYRIFLDVLHNFLFCYPKRLCVFQNSLFLTHKHFGLYINCVLKRYVQVRRQKRRQGVAK
jgi:hypothetical protein